MLLEKIESPADVRKLSADELKTLAAEIREALVRKVSARGGHCGPNLGIVEATIALHRVFDSPRDKIVFDVSHQSYVHKMLTGRARAFLDPARWGDVTGYTEPSESEHDHFLVGHTSTSVSLALGLATARDLKGGDWNVVAVIGDGSLSGGEAFEGLDNAGEYATNFIVVVNDNEMSIAENHGGLYRSLAALRETEGAASDNYFKALGFDYLYVEEGNDVEALEKAFRAVKGTKKPVVVHIHTRKGLGLRMAEERKEQFHWTPPFDPGTGAPLGAWGESWPDILRDYLVGKIESDPDVVVVHSAVPVGIGFTEDVRKRVGKRFVDVGIAEEHAVALVSGMAKGGAKPVYSTHGTFIQRAYDQISQDLAVNGNPATILVTMSGADGMNDASHLCVFDIPMISNIPNVLYLCPTCVEEFRAMADWAIDQRGRPVAIRVPNAVIHRDAEFDADYGEPLRSRIERKGSRVALFGLGDFFALAERAAAELAKSGIEATLVNPRFASGADRATVEALAKDHEIFVTLENGSVSGGFGEKVAAVCASLGVRALVRGLRKEFYDRVPFPELLRRNRLLPEQIAEDALAALGK